MTPRYLPPREPEPWFGFILILSAMGLILCVALALFLALCPGCAKATPWICPSARVNDELTTLYRQTRTKPALYATFYDSVYATCWERISNDSTGGSSGEALVPAYSQMQAWNADQSKIWLVSGRILNNPSYTLYRRASMGAATAFRWSPIYPDTGYYYGGTNSSQVRGWNIENDNTFLVHDFSATYHGGLDKPSAAGGPLTQEDVSNNGWMGLLGYFRWSTGSSSHWSDTLQVWSHVTNGSTNVTWGSAAYDSIQEGTEVYEYSGSLPNHTTVHKVSNTQLTLSNAWTGATKDTILAFCNARVFGYNVLTDQVTSSIPAYSRNCSGGIEDIFVAPKGDYLIVHWGTVNAHTYANAADSLCGVVAYDTLMIYKGKVACGRSHGDFAVDSKGREWMIAGNNGADCGPSGGPTGVSVYKYRIPNGQDLYAAQGNVENDTTIIGLSRWATTGIHVSCRAFGTDFAIVSSDHCQSPGCSQVTTWSPFQDEIVKVFYDSRIGAPHLERLADTRSDESRVSHSSCVLASYWAQPHATVSRDGTKVIWGSSWGDSGALCSAESYVMDICRTARNDTLVNMKPNSWRRINAPRVLKFDGTGGAAADTNAPYRVYSGQVFAPELGAIVSFGGGSDGQSQGLANDIWYWTPADTLWRQATYPDSINKYPRSFAYRGANQDSTINGPYSIRDYYTLVGGMRGSIADTNTWVPWANQVVSAFKPIGSTLNKRPWSSHAANALGWDSYQRKFYVTNTNFIWQPNAPDSICPGESLFTITCTWTAGSNVLHSNHLFGPIPRSGNGVAYPASPRTICLLNVVAPGLSNSTRGHSVVGTAIETTFVANTISSDSTITMSRNANSTSQAGGETVTFGYCIPGQGYFAFTAKNSWAYPFYHRDKNWSYQDQAAAWALVDTLPDLKGGQGSAAYDPVNRKLVAYNADIFHVGGSTGFQPPWVWTLDTLGVWARKQRGQTDGHHSPYYTNAVYDRYSGKILWYPASSDTTMFGYDVAADAWSDYHPTRDPVYGKPGLGDMNTAYDSKDAKLFAHGYNGNNGSWQPSWMYDVPTHQWTKLNTLDALHPTTGFEPDSAGVRDRDNHLSYDPTNNAIYMIRQNGSVQNCGNGQTTVIASPTAEIWVYKPSAGDGRLFSPLTITPSAGSCGSTSGL